jgi:hypothetical protein
MNEEERLKRYCTSVTVTLEIDYCDIEARSEEEAEKIACERAREDVDFNNCDCVDNFEASVWDEQEI